MAVVIGVGDNDNEDVVPTNDDGDSSNGNGVMTRGGKTVECTGNTGRNAEKPSVTDNRRAGVIIDGW